MAQVSAFDDSAFTPPRALQAIEKDSRQVGFSMASEVRTGCLLRALAASKPGGAILELGTGTGISTAWILDGMDVAARLQTVEIDGSCVEVARRHLGNDPRLTFHVEEGDRFLERQSESSFDLIFADSWPGKFDHLENALRLLRVGGLYIIDDLMPQPNWPKDHAPKVPAFVSQLERDTRLITCKLAWSSGILIATRVR